MEPPFWLNFEILQKALWNLNENFELLAFKSTRAVPDGDNYTSDLFRTHLTYVDRKSNDKNSLSIIAKCANEDGDFKTKFAQTLNLFHKEISIFTKIFPKLYELLDAPFTLSSRCFYAARLPHSVLILEDLTTLNFEILPRQLGFDLEHCFKVLGKMADLHAASVVLHDSSPSLFTDFTEGLYRDNDMTKTWVVMGCQALADACHTWPGFEPYARVIKTLDVLARGLKASQRDNGGFSVLNHGDTWTNNMMFSHDTQGGLQDMRFVDFQMAFFTSPAVDLHYFIATSPKTNVLTSSITTMLDYYYSQLTQALGELNFDLGKAPSRGQFEEDFNSRAFYGLMGAVTVLPLVKASKRNDATLENAVTDDGVHGFRYHCFNNDRYREQMQVLLPFYRQFGVFD